MPLSDRQREYQREWQRKRRLKDGEREKDAARAADYRARNPEKALEVNRTWRMNLRLEMITAYGGSCSCCGESHPLFLALDHIFGKTNDDDLSGIPLWQHAKKLNWPDIYRLLCHNCNMGRASNGGVCPHDDVQD